jgi:phytoene dehydrogenase-like protein
MRRVLITVAILTIAACAPSTRGVNGEVAKACIAGGRDAANRALCSCVQQVANQSLNASDQRRAVTFFDDPETAQQVRQSDRAADNAFWDRYRAFADRAAQICG